MREPIRGQHPNTQPINERWVSFTLNARGIKCHSRKAIANALTGMDPVTSSEFRARVVRIQTGGEQQGDMECMAQWVRDANLAEQLASEPANADTDTDTDAPRPALAATPAPVTAPRTFEKSLHVYSSTGAMCVERVAVSKDEQPDSSQRAVFHTVQLELASALARNKFDWDKKIIFQLTRRELPLFAACLFGYCQTFVCGNHGDERNKFLTVKCQDDGSVYFQLKMRNRVIGVPVGAEEMFDLLSEVLLAIGKNAPHVDSQTVVQMIKRAGVMYHMATGRTES